MVGDFYRLYTESVGDLGYIPYIPNSPTGGHSGRKTSHGGRSGYIYDWELHGFQSVSFLIFFSHFEYSLLIHIK